MASLFICMAQVEESFTLLFTASRIAKNSAWEMPAGAGGLLRLEGTHRHGARELRQRGLRGWRRRRPARMYQVKPGGRCVCLAVNPVSGRSHQVTFSAKERGFKIGSMEGGAAIFFNLHLHQVQHNVSINANTSITVVIWIPCAMFIRVVCIYL